MSAAIREWESDPLFSAAEVVQDSADRMESMFRILLHEQSLDHGDAADPRLLTSIDYHRRDVVTALETTKWQLEDFERAVNQAEVSDSYHSREDAISRHKQFIRAIRAHISQVEKSLGDYRSAGDVSSSKQWGNLDEQDRDGLALFLSGGNRHHDHVKPYDSENSSIMRRFLDSTTASGFDDNTDEIIELKSEENEDSKMNGVMHIDRGLDAVKENNMRKVGSTTRVGYEVSIAIQEGLGDEVVGGANWGLEGCDSNAKSFFSKNKQRGSWHNILEVFNKYWSIYGSKMTRSFTKRRKDGDLEDEFNPRPSSSYSSYVDICQAEQGHGLYSNVLTSALKSCSWLGLSNARCKRLHYLIQVNRSSVWLISAVFVTLIIFGILVNILR
ncbi:hypothetical protein MKW94_015538 [Papaver nudicaule]|uniref:Syntaxin 6/10/61 N-terminal domain-containing protein n=1 Tax=Papaver nudicaule TaxID=74823 RepID=A0AA41RR53_PAPNU|nr:hypothetical protein [Papaver nudicaule]